MITLDGLEVARAESDPLRLDPIRGHAAVVGEAMAADEVRAAAPIRARVPPVVEDRARGPDIEAVEAVLASLPEELSR